MIQYINSFFQKLPRDWELSMAERRVTYESNTFLVRWYRPNAEIVEEPKEKKDEEDEYEVKSEEEEVTWVDWGILSGSSHL